MFIYVHGNHPNRGKLIRTMVKRPKKLDLRLTEAEYELVLRFKRDNGHGTKSAAAQDMLRRQGRYSLWRQSRHGKRKEEEAVLRNIAREILREHPDATKAALGWNMTKRAGEVVHAGLIKKIVNELVSR